jgi:hypothetical protein
MIDIDQFYIRNSDLISNRSIHIICLSFEERCIAYPKKLKDLKLSAQTHSFLCIDLPDENLSGFLREGKRANKLILNGLLPSVEILSYSDLEKRVQKSPAPLNIYLDMSGLPRKYIFKILDFIYSKYEQSEIVRIFCVYTYPKKYVFGNLQKPATDVEYIFASQHYFEDQSIALFVMPGFDLEYTNAGLLHVNAINKYEHSITWFIPFPGIEYRFYERVIESHLHYLRDTNELNILLYPQEEIKLAFWKLSQHIDGIASPLLILPLGCRIICISLFLAVFAARKKKKIIDVILPETVFYDSIRSEGFVNPIIEEIPAYLGRWIEK